MNPIVCENAFFIKLGSKGEWEKSSIQNSILRIGWKEQDLSDINSGNWDKIEKELIKESKTKGVATRDFRALRMICESNNNDIWITFYKSCLWWTKVTDPQIHKDEHSKFRMATKWSNKDIFGRTLLINNISGRISKIQGFRGTICKVKEIEGLRRIINGEQSSEYKEINNCKINLCHSIEKALGLLHWKDFEILVDLIFRASGWRRISVLGETMKFSDIELEDPINRELYQVQVKSSAGVEEFEEYKQDFLADKYRKLFFVVHNPVGKLSGLKLSNEGKIQLILPEQLSKLVVELGLTNWLMNKIK